MVTWATSVATLAWYMNTSLAKAGVRPAPLRLSALSVSASSSRAPLETSFLGAERVPERTAGGAVSVSPRRWVT